MTQEEDYIIFEEVNNKNLDKNAGQIAKHPILGHYNSLYEELLEKCNPACFLEQYNKRKVELANIIYLQVLENKNNYEILKSLRSKATKELDIKFATIDLYNLLINACNPQNYTGKNYNFKKLEQANELYDQILKYADDIEALERIYVEACGMTDLTKFKHQSNSFKNEKDKIKEKNIEYNRNRAKREFSFLIILFAIIFGLLFVLSLLEIIHQ